MRVLYIGEVSSEGQEPKPQLCYNIIHVINNHVIMRLQCNYTADVASLVESFGLRVHLYADDTQLYGFSSPDDSAALADLIRRAIDSVSEWMASNRLLLNGDKTQYIWFGTKQQLGKRDVQRLTDTSPALTFVRRP